MILAGFRQHQRQAVCCIVVELVYHQRNIASLGIGHVVAPWLSVNHRLWSISGCGGGMNGNTYVTGPVTGDCVVSAAFTPNVTSAPVDNAWTSVGPEGGTVRALVIDPTNHATVYAGTISNGVFKSIDGGRTWASSNNGLSPYVTFLVIDPVTPSTLYAGGWGDGDRDQVRQRRDRG